MKSLLAQGITNPIVGNSGEGKGLPFFSIFVPRLITLGLIVGSLIFFFVLLIGAIQWMTSGGDKAAVEAARGKITNAIIGVVLLFAIFVILSLVGDFFNISLTQFTLPKLTR